MNESVMIFNSFSEYVWHGDWATDALYRDPAGNFFVSPDGSRAVFGDNPEFGEHLQTLPKEFEIVNCYVLQEVK
jgi:hypothetical protein